MSAKTDRAKQFFQQAKDSYPGKNSPNFFNSPFTVPSEQLYIEMCSIVGIKENYKHRTSFRQIFDARLRSLFEDGKDFDENYLGRDIRKTIAERKTSSYWVYFGVPIKKSSSTQLPFGKTIRLDDITFKSIDYKQFLRAHKKECLTDYRHKFTQNLPKNYSEAAVIRSLHYFKAKVEASDVIEASNLVADAFSVLYVCATVAQNSHSYRHSMGGSKIKSRSVLAPVGVMLTSDEDHDNCDVLWGTDIRVVSDESLTFTSNEQKMKFFSDYLRACRTDTPISNRLRQFLFTFAESQHTLDPHLRQLGLWRCLEIATSKNGYNRSYDDIVKIIGNFYGGTAHWKQQGKLIRNARNNFVHYGTTLEQDAWGSVDKYLNWTQEYADKALVILRWMKVKNIGKQSHGEIDDFFDLYPKSNKTLKMAVKMLEGRSK